MNAYRLLIVDDDSPYRERLAKALRSRGFEVQTAASVPDALQAVQNWTPTHALVDLKMPGPSGLDFIRILRSTCKQAYIVVLTGFGSIASAVEALKIGADDFRTKPLDADAIENALLKLRPSQAPQIPVPSLDLVEWEHLQRVLHDCQNNISQAARILGINRRSLQRKLSKYPPQS